MRSLPGAGEDWILRGPEQQRVDRSAPGQEYDPVEVYAA